MDLPAEESDDDTTTRTSAVVSPPKLKTGDASQSNSITIGSSIPPSPRSPSPFAPPVAHVASPLQRNPDDNSDNDAELEQEHENGSEYQDEDMRHTEVRNGEQEAAAGELSVDEGGANMIPAENLGLDRKYRTLERSPSPYASSDGGYGSGDSGRVRISQLMQGPPSNWGRGRGSRSPSLSDDPYGEYGMEVDRAKGQARLEVRDQGPQGHDATHRQPELFHRGKVEKSDSNNEERNLSHQQIHDLEAELSDPVDDDDHNYSFGASHIVSEDEVENPTEPINPHDPVMGKIPVPDRRKHAEKISDRYVHRFEINPHCSRLLRNVIRQTKRHNIYTHDCDKKFSKVYNSTVGSVFWRTDEKDRFFDALALYSPDGMKKIAAAVRTKSELECSEYLQALKEGYDQRFERTNNRGRGKIQLWDIPAAYEFPEELITAMDWEALKIEKKVLHQDKLHERNQWQFWYNITQEMAGQLDKYVEEENMEALDATAPEGELLNVSQMLHLSEFFYMNGPGEANYRTHDPENKPSIWYNALLDFHEIVRGVTRRLLAAVIYEMEMRKKLNFSDGSENITIHDVHAAVKGLGMKTSSYDYWITVARRNNLRVVQKTQEMNYKDPETLNYDIVEGYLHKLTPKEEFMAFACDEVQIRLHRQAEEAAAKKAWESTQPRYLSPPPERKSLKEDPDDDSWIEYDDDHENTNDGYFNHRKLAATEDKYHSQAEAVAELVDSLQNAQRVQWQWLRAFGRRVPLKVNHSGVRPKLPNNRIEGRLFKSRDWREKAYFNALRIPLRRKMTLEEKIRNRSQVIQKATTEGNITQDTKHPWRWARQNVATLPTWIPVWVPQGQRGKARPKGPEPPPGMDLDYPEQPYDYKQGKWIGKLLDPIAERRAHERRRRRLRKLASQESSRFPPPSEAFPVAMEPTERRRRHQEYLETLEKNMVRQDRHYRVPRRPLIWGKKIDEPGQNIEDLRKNWRLAGIELNRSLEYHKQRERKVGKLKVWWEQEKERRREKREAENVVAATAGKDKTARKRKRADEGDKASLVKPKKQKRRVKSAGLVATDDETEAEDDVNEPSSPPSSRQPRQKKTVVKESTGVAETDDESGDGEKVNESTPPRVRQSKRKKAVAKKSWLQEAVDQFEERDEPAEKGDYAGEEFPDEDKDISDTPMPSSSKRKTPVTKLKDSRPSRVVETTKRRIAASKRPRKPSVSPPSSQESHHTQSDLEAADYLSFIAQSTPKVPRAPKPGVSLQKRKQALELSGTRQEEEEEDVEESRLEEADPDAETEEAVPIQPPLKLVSPTKRSPPPEWSAPAKRRKTGVTYGKFSTKKALPPKKKATSPPPPAPRSSRSQRQRWQASLPAGFVSTADAVNEDGDVGMEGLDKEAEEFLKAMADEESASEFEGDEK